MRTLLFVAPHIGYGGAEKNFIGIANYAVSHGYKVFLLTEEGRENLRTIDERIVRLSAHISNDASLIKKYLQAIFAIKTAIGHSHADVVISFIELWRSASVIATRLSRTKCIVSERADPYTRSGRFNRIIFGIFALADGYVFQTPQARDFFSSKVKRKAIVIPNPVFEEDALQEYVGEKKKIIVSIARLDIEQKRQDLIIDAFNLIKDDFPEHVLYLYGDGKDKQILEEQISRLGLQKRVFFKGITRNVYQSLGETQVMIMASDYEGMPNAIIESMCVGVPVVSTKCSPGGAEYLINNNENGILVERGDVKGLADGVKRLLIDKDLYEHVRKNGFEVKTKLDSKILLPLWTAYIEKTITD